jgi:hypothetical protein
MNDFSKQELQDIEFALQTVYLGNSELIKKIQFRIENYCVHKNDIWPLYTSTGDIPVAGMCYECGNPVDRMFLNE